MNNTQKTTVMLFLLENLAYSHDSFKGYDSFTSSKYEEGATWLLECLKACREIDYMPAHTVQIRISREH